MEKNGLFQDVNGSISSKRVFGAIGLAFAGALALLGVFLKSDVAAGLVWPFITFAGAVFGVSVAERRQ